MKLKNLSFLTGCLSLFALSIFLAPLAAHAQDCTSVTDSEIVGSIVGMLKTDKVLSPQLSHIAVTSVNKFVKLQGWTDTRSAYDRLIAIVSSVKCVKAINVNNFSETLPPPESSLRVQGGGCATGTKPCGDVCIPEAETCGSQPE